MRDILIKILESGVDPIDGADIILKTLRCENCKNWRPTEATDWRTNEPTGYCYDRIPDHGVITIASQFCEKFEQK